MPELKHVETTLEISRGRHDGKSFPIKVWVCSECGNHLFKIYDIAEEHNHKQCLCGVTYCNNLEACAQLIQD